MIDATLSGLTKWLAATPLSHAIQTTGWIIPSLQTIHILSVAVVFFFAILLVTGSLLIAGEPRRSLLNSTFYLKMALLAVAIMLTAGLQRSIASSPDSWDKNRGLQMAGRFAATLS